MPIIHLLAIQNILVHYSYNSGTYEKFNLNLTVDHAKYTYQIQINTKINFDLDFF